MGYGWVIVELRLECSNILYVCRKSGMWGRDDAIVTDGQTVGPTLADEKLTDTS